VRLTLTRGEKVTSGMSPSNNRCGPCLVVLAEWKPPVFGARGLRLVTSSWRRNAPQCLDSKIHHANLLNNILAKIDAERAGVDEALMLDVDGYLAETNATNVFLVRAGELLTPLPDACLPGITRGLVLGLAREQEIAVSERRLTLADAYACAEMFTTGTLGELTHVVEVDGRKIGDGSPGPLTRRLQQLFRAATQRLGTPILG
jgi:branched-subunit amino acid aminotransferase/4-amino-4-deoxychorismate lyase